MLWNQVAYGKPLTRMKSTGCILRLFRADNLIGYEGLLHEAVVRAPFGDFYHRAVV